MLDQGRPIIAGPLTMSARTAYRSLCEAVTRTAGLPAIAALQVIDSRGAASDPFRTFAFWTILVRCAAILQDSQ